MTDCISKIRNLIGDLLDTTGIDTFEYISSKIFSLTESNIVSSSILVYKNGALWADSNYSYSSITGKLTVTGSLTLGDSLEITYSFYPKYSDTEIKSFIRNALYYISINKYKTFTAKSDDAIFPTPTELEQNLIAIIATILMKGDVVGYKTSEFTITFERGDSKEKKISKIVKQFSKTTGVLEYIQLDAKSEVEEN